MINFKNIWHNIKYGMVNLFTYFFIIWEDRDWDHVFFYKLMRKKLQRMVKSFKKWDSYEEVETDIKRMEFCIRCLNRLIENNYCENILKERDRFNKKKIEERDEKEYYQFLNNAVLRKERDLKVLFSTLEKYIEYWWD